eukprot:1905172-Pleurochrysis_carterae.AAC.1
MRERENERTREKLAKRRGGALTSVRSMRCVLFSFIFFFRLSFTSTSTSSFTSFFISSSRHGPASAFGRPFPNRPDGSGQRGRRRVAGGPRSSRRRVMRRLKERRGRGET